MASNEAKQPVKPNWSGEARLPQTIRLPVQVANAVYGVGSGRREIVIRRDNDEVPELIIQWMQGTPLYRTWFLSGQHAQQAKPEPKTLPKEEPEADVLLEVEEEPAADTDEPDKPKRGRRKKAADGDNEDA